MNRRAACNGPSSAVGHEAAALTESEAVQGNCAIAGEFVGVQEHLRLCLQV